MGDNNAKTRLVHFQLPQRITPGVWSHQKLFYKAFKEVEENGEQTLKNFTLQKINEEEQTLRELETLEHTATANTVVNIYRKLRKMKRYSRIRVSHCFTIQTVEVSFGMVSARRMSSSPKDSRCWTKFQR